MEFNYIVVLFKNRTKQKILKKFKTLNRVNQYYKSLEHKSNNIIFEKQYENGFKCDYQLGLLKYGKGGVSSIFMQDYLGRNVKVDFEDTDYELIKMIDYRVEELIFDVQLKKRLTVDQFIQKYLTKPGLKMISKINNKIIVQYEEKFKMFSLKTDNDSQRFVDNLSKEFQSKGKMDCIFVQDWTLEQKKYLYEFLESNGIPKKILYRHSTTFPVKLHPTEK
jgi:phage pi2 protein 07